ncbi:YhgE/Pip domain-containing protein [Paenibacillus sp. Leaf72]|uniref:YhgE/Pip domain-containing protein n=1 Tax=Paenibacillus sp. Leaf72 TaxID=1736234 RepID=UPI0006FAE43F|nr:ABC transporter permease [Paenibacillus sp. Leaf72]KQN96177.1 ABC transporter [Paenibacillus sp. Leaf72]
MKNTIQAFMKRPTTIVGIITALMFQIVFSVIWMTGYNGVTDRIDKLHIAVVNEDQQFGTQIAGSLVSSLPFQMSQPSSLEDAKQQLNARELQMIIYFPADFTQKAMAADGKADIGYIINESNPALIKSIMSGVAAEVTKEANAQAIEQGIAGTLGKAGIPTEQAAIAGQSLAERITANIESTNQVKGMNNQMVPMMMVLASYVGAMIMGMNLEQSSMMVSAGAGRWKRFAARSIITAGSAIFVSLIGSSLLAAFNGQMEQGFLKLWLFQLMFVLAFMFVSQMFLYVFGMAGMLFNIIALSAQLVSSGAIVPRELLPDFYVKLGEALPATYAVEGLMNVLFGGTGIGSEVAALAIIAIVGFVISMAAVGLKKQAVMKPGQMAMKSN